MKISRSQARVIKVDEAVTIEGLFDGKNFAFDIVIGSINGHHPKLINHVSDRAYFVLKGTVDITVGESIHNANIHDLILVPAGTPHSVEGEGEYLIITSPPFAPENEELLT